MDEVAKSFLEWWREKTNSPLYFAFIFAFIVWNWKVLYVLFFESETLLNTTRVEYIEQFSRLYYQFSYNGSWFDILVHPLNWLLVLLFIFGIPILITYLVIWQLPKLHSIAHDKHLEFLFARKKSYHLKSRLFEEDLANELEKILVAIRRQRIVKKDIEKELTLEQKWDADYALFKTQKLYSSFNQIIDCIYKKDGHLDQWTPSGKIRVINQNLLALIDSLDLISFKEDASNNVSISFTPKGKYFSGKYQKENQQF